MRPATSRFLCSITNILVRIASPSSTTRCARLSTRPAPHGCSAGLNLGPSCTGRRSASPRSSRSVASIVTYPQYWAFRLCGIAAVEATSLGCHTDLWDPYSRDFSTLVSRQGWHERMAPLRPAADRARPVTPEAAAATGLSSKTPVYCGIHDSNASLLPHLRNRRAPFSVVSTGTWVITMAIGGREPCLDPARDTLINVSAFGDAVPSARFMGGREWEMAMQGRRAVMSPQDVKGVLERGVMLLPSIEQGSGPFAGRASAWIGAGG